jgi:hypothetical protein
MSTPDLSPAPETSVNLEAFSLIGIIQLIYDKRAAYPLITVDSCRYFGVG